MKEFINLEKILLILQKNHEIQNNNNFSINLNYR